jgi:hypothetical protein
VERLRPIWQRRLLASAVSAALGILLVLISELGDVHQTRIFGAALITSGGFGLGIDAALSSSRRWPGLARIRERRVMLALAATLLLSTPILIALVAALAGAVGDAANRDALLTALGALIALAMLAASLLAGAFAIRAVAGALRGEPGIGQDQQPVEQPR